MNNKYFLFYKPYQVLSAFTTDSSKITLAEFGFPRDVYPVGRLDYDSEGLLLLTDDKSLNNKLLNPKFSHRRTYYVQVENLPSSEQIEHLKSGLAITIDGKIHNTKRCHAELLTETPLLPERFPPIRQRLNIPTAWLSISLTEGKNRQVRKMTAKIGCPTLRLVRYSIENICIQGFSSGEVRSIDKSSVYDLLNITI